MDQGDVSREFKNIKELGNWGEKQARQHLMKNNYRLIAENYRTRWAEIDLIVLKEDFLVFVEVKTRRSNSFGLPETSIGYTKQKKIRQLASYFLIKKDYNQYQVRFDVITILIDKEKGSMNLNHIKNAF